MMQGPDIAIVEQTGIPSWLVYATLPALGALIAVVVAVMMSRMKEPSFWKEISALLGSIFGSGVIGAASELAIEIRSTDLTPSEGLWLALSGAVGAWLLILLSIPVLICTTVLLPLALKCGPRCAGQAARHIFYYRDRKASIAEFWTRFSADSAWDEFATALAHGLASMDSAETISRLFRGIVAPSTPSESKQDEDTEIAGLALKLLREALEKPLEKFSVHTGANKFRFSLWRIDSTGRNLERIWMMPDRDERRPIALWRNDSAGGEPASHATTVLQSQTPDVLTSSDPRTKRFPCGRIGIDYIAIRGSPIKCIQSRSPWGVLYIDLCHGSIPLESEAVKLLSRRLVDAIEPLGPALKIKTFSEASS